MFKKLIIFSSIFMISVFNDSFCCHKRKACNCRPTISSTRGSLTKSILGKRIDELDIDDAIKQAQACVDACDKSIKEDEYKAKRKKIPAIKNQALFLKNILELIQPLKITDSQRIKDELEKDQNKVLNELKEAKRLYSGEMGVLVDSILGKAEINKR